MSSFTEPFDCQLRTRIVFGAGSVDGLGEHARALGGGRVLVVTDAAVTAAGHAERVQRSLRTAGLGLAVEVYDGVRADPTTRDVDHCVAAAREARIDLFVAVGGGSSLDTAKGANFLLTNGGEMRDYQGYGMAREPMLPLIAVPTTAGTGSEVQSYALIADEATKAKMACGDPQAAPRLAVLDPELTVTQPPRVTAGTGLDAIGHAVETAVTRRRTPISQLFSRRAFLLANEHLPRVLSEAADLEARGAMLQAACFAGIAIEQSMLGAAHSMANPLTAGFDMAHGQAVATMLPHVVRFNASEPAAAATYAALARDACLCEPGASEPDAALALAARLSALLVECGLPATLGESDVSADALPGLAADAAEQWTAQFNPRAVREADFLALYRAAH